MPQSDVVVLMGSASDWPHLEGAVQLLGRLGLEVQVHVTSAHRTPERTLEIVRQAEGQGCRAFICAAGMAAHLAGAVAAHTLRPVLGVPLPGGILDGMDALLATVQMPPGIPVATFGVGAPGARNAACFAAQLIALDRPEVKEAVEKERAAGVTKVLEGDRTVKEALS